ncbi:MAG: molybdopterin molybdotransferase MoeA [Betaproteobacteria bacterium]|nr:molybdopterin molybdotransferase MoeA [Betaproteobacteria bacterium]MBV9361882.1 molybdopterin molybdotransferase MoeA [Betaproteobacteria bacterium]
MKRIIQIISGLEGYDPDALRVDKAREAMRACITPISDTEKVPVRAALGRVLAQGIVPDINVPSHDNSAMDGYALRFADIEKPLTEIGTALAGKPFSGAVGSGQCVRIMTGAVMPAGADTVVIQEVVKRDGNRITVPPGQKRAQNVRYAGEDLKIGAPVLTPGKYLRPAELGLISSLGIGEVQVKRKVRVAFFSTGDELASIGTRLKEGEVYDSNRYTLHGMLARLGVEIEDLGVVRDDPQALEAALRKAVKADAIITTGGVSVGEADFIRDLMAKLGEVLFWKIAMRPGRPMAFGRIGNAYLFGLPGNPVAVMVTFYQFVRDALLHLSGRQDDYAIPLLRATAAENLRKVPGRTEYQRGVLFRDGGEWKVRITGQQGSGVLRSMAEANCFVVLEHERGAVKAGESVSVQVMEGLA